MRVVEYFITLFSLHVNVAKTKQKTKVPLCEFENYSTSTSTNNFNQSLYHGCAMVTDSVTLLQQRCMCDTVNQVNKEYQNQKRMDLK